MTNYTESTSGGGAAASLSPILALRRITLAAMLWDNVAYYEDNISEVKRLVPQVDAVDMANLVSEMIHSQHLKSMPLFVIVEMMKYPQFKAYIEPLVYAATRRPDLAARLLGIYWKEQKDAPIPNAVKRAISRRFADWSDYQIAKYKSGDMGISLSDILRLIHPRPNGFDRDVLYFKLRHDLLSAPVTWESALSSGADKAQAWMSLVSGDSLPDMAFMMNVRNMKDSGVPNEMIVERLRRVHSSYISPLQFYKTYLVAPELASELDAAKERCYANVGKLSGNSIFVVDVSGSMGTAISIKSDFTRMAVAANLAADAQLRCENVEIYITAGDDFSCSHATKRMDGGLKGFALVGSILRDSTVGCGGIFTRQMLDYVRNETAFQSVDRIMIFSDSQDCDRTNRTPATPFGWFNYIIDVSANRNGVAFDGRGWTAEISGMSDQFLRYIAALEGVDAGDTEE